MTTTPHTAEALALADLIDSDWTGFDIQKEAAALIRSQAQEIERLSIYPPLYAALRLAIDPAEAMTNADAVAEAHSMRDENAKLEAARKDAQRMRKELSSLCDTLNSNGFATDAARAAMEQSK